MPSYLPPFSQEQKLDKSELLFGFQTYFLAHSLWPIFYPFSLLPYLISPPFSHAVFGVVMKEMKEQLCNALEQTPRCTKSLRSVPFALWWGLDLQKRATPCPCELAFIYLFSGLFPNTSITGFFLQRTIIPSTYCPALATTPYLFHSAPWGKCSI